MSKTPYNPDEHLVDILEPPLYLPGGKTQEIVDAIRAGDWLHTSDVWVYRTEPELQILFQQRRPDSPTHAGKLDCSVAGYLEAGELPEDGAIREMHEELGVLPLKDHIHALGRRLNAMIDHRGRERHIVANYHVYDISEHMNELKINPEEVFAVFWIAVQDVIKVSQGEEISIRGIDAHGNELITVVSKSDFVYNVDDYHFRVAERLKMLHEKGEL